MIFLTSVVTHPVIKIGITRSLPKNITVIFRISQMMRDHQFINLIIIYMFGLLKFGLMHSILFVSVVDVKEELKP